MRWPTRCTAARTLERAHDHRPHHHRGRHRRRRRDSSRRAGRGDVLDQCRGGRYSITDVDPARWDPAFYYDPNPKAPDKTYSKIGGWVRDWAWEPLAWKLPIPPRVGESIDDAQKWAVACTRAALLDYGWPERPIDGERTAVVLGNAMSGEHHYLTALRIAYPELAFELDRAPSFQALPSDVQKLISAEFGELLGARYPEITEDTMPGELGNCMAGRVANLFDFHGPNYVVDAACASAMAAIGSSLAGLVTHEYDTVIAGGVDRNMGASSYVKFCKIGALSATGTRPFDAGADGFVMGEGAGLFVLKRLADAEPTATASTRCCGASPARATAGARGSRRRTRSASDSQWSAPGATLVVAGVVRDDGVPRARRPAWATSSRSRASLLPSPGEPASSVARSRSVRPVEHRTSVKARRGVGSSQGGDGAATRELPPCLGVEGLTANLDWAVSPFSCQRVELRDLGGTRIRRTPSRPVHVRVWPHPF